MSQAGLDFSQLAVAKRIQLAEDLWDSLPADAPPLGEAHVEELRRRRELLRADPTPAKIGRKH